MQNLNDLVKRYTIKQDQLIKNICNPLKDCLGITLFTYYFIEPDGHFGMVCSHTHLMDLFFNEKLYSTHPYFKHPHLLRSGYSLAPAIPDPNFLEIYDKRYQVRDLFYMCKHRGEGLEGFVFGVSLLDINNCANFYLENLNLLNKFTSYFMQKHDGFNLKQAIGEFFLESNTSWSLSNTDPKELRFLKAISPLSRRELQCLELYKQGHSSQTTAAMLGLSQRTIEHYFENMKNKLGCNSKRDLLSF
jgi:DNA-binding CsgD family transcriptional regulator